MYGPHIYMVWALTGIFDCVEMATPSPFVPDSNTNKLIAVTFRTCSSLIGKYDHGGTEYYLHD
jgi:hypothetical protein